MQPVSRPNGSLSFQMFVRNAVVFAQAALRRRRVRVWLVMVGAIVATLLVTAALPDSRWLAALGIELSPTMILLLFLAALGCEYVDSSLGMGYGTALTPALLLMGFEPLQIVPTVLLSEFLTGLTAGLLHQRDGNVDLVRDRQARRTAVLLGILSGVGTVAAVTLALSISKFWLTAGIGSIILLMGVVILATIHRQLRYRPAHLITVGAIAAFNKGLSGGGYGPLVTAGQVVSGISPRQAVGITSLSESLTCLIGLVAYLLLHHGVDWSIAIPLTTGALLSVPVATLTVRRLPAGVLRGAVGLTTLGLGVLTLVKLLIA